MAHSNSSGSDRGDNDKEGRRGLPSDGTVDTGSLGGLGGRYAGIGEAALARDTGRSGADDILLLCRRTSSAALALLMGVDELRKDLRIDFRFPMREGGSKSSIASETGTLPAVV